MPAELGMRPTALITMSLSSTEPSARASRACARRPALDGLDSVPRWNSTPISSSACCTARADTRLSLPGSTWSMSSTTVTFVPNVAYAHGELESDDATADDDELGRDGS